MTRNEWRKQYHPNSSPREIYLASHGKGPYRRIIGQHPSTQRDVYDKWQRAKIANLKTIASLAGLTKADLSKPATLDNKLATWINGLTIEQKIAALRRLAPFWVALLELTEGGLDMDAEAQQEIPGDPIYAEPPYIEHGFEPYADVFEVEREIAAGGGQ